MCNIDVKFSKIVEIFFENFAKIGFKNKIKVWEGVIHLPEGWEWDSISRHVPYTSFNLSTPGHCLRYTLVTFWWTGGG